MRINRNDVNYHCHECRSIFHESEIDSKEQMCPECNKRTLDTVVPISCPECSNNSFELFLIDGNSFLVDCPNCEKVSRTDEVGSWW